MLTQEAKARGLWLQDKEKVKGNEHARIEGGKVVVRDGRPDGKTTTSDTVTQGTPVIDTADNPGAVIAKIDLEDLKGNELAKMAKKMGIVVPRWSKKAEIIALIERAQRVRNA